MIILCINVMKNNAHETAFIFFLQNLISYFWLWGKKKKKSSWLF